MRVVLRASSDRNRPSVQGFGYTSGSMRSTWRRWRRRNGTRSTCRSVSARGSAVTRSLAMSGLPVDLRVGLAQVERLELPRADEVLSQRPGVGELHERRRRREGDACLADLDL